MPLSAHVSPAIPASSEATVSPIVVTIALNTASTSSVPKAATRNVRRR